MKRSISLSNRLKLIHLKRKNSENLLSGTWIWSLSRTFSIRFKNFFFPKPRTTYFFFSNQESSWLWQAKINITPKYSISIFFLPQSDRTKSFLPTRDSKHIWSSWMKIVNERCRCGVLREERSENETLFTFLVGERVRRRESKPVWPLHATLWSRLKMEFIWSVCWDNWNLILDEWDNSHSAIIIRNCSWNYNTTRKCYGCEQLGMFRMCQSNVRA